MGPLIDEQQWPGLSAGILRVLVGVMKQFNPDLTDHCVRVAKGAQVFANTIGWSGKEVGEVYLAGLFHDMGYTVTHHDRNDFMDMDKSEDGRSYYDHPKLSERLIGRSEAMAEVRSIVRHHHENFNGSGFPDGLTGAHIPRGARLLSIVDFYERMTVPRGSIGGMDPEEAKLIITEDAGIIYDPEMVKIFLNKVVDSEAFFKD